MELRQYVTIVWKRLWLVILTTLLGGGSAFYFNYTAPPVYRASTTLEINLGSTQPGDTYQALRTSEMVGTTYVEQIQAPVLLREVIDNLALSMSAGALQNKLTVEQIRDTQLIRISAESNDPALAKALAETVARTFIERERSRQRSRFQADLDDLESQIAALEESIAQTQAALVSLGDPDEASSEFARMERTRLESQLTRDQTRLVVLLQSAEEFRLAMARSTDNITVYSPAELPTAPAGPSTMRNTLLGSVTGLMIGVGTAFLLEYLDDTIRSPEDIKRTLPVAVLGTLPRLKESDDHLLTLVVGKDPFQPVAEAFRNLRTSIQFSAVDEPVRTLLVTSPLPTDGKTFTAANLAAVMAQGGRDVILVDSDLRRSVQHRVFGLPKEPGVTSVMLSPEEQEIILRETDIKGLKVVTGGARAPNPAELLASDRFQDFVAWLREQADVVIFDSPPVLAVTDAAVLSTVVDATLLVVDHGRTRRTAAAQATERLMNVGGNLLGIVLNRLPPNGDGYYYYHYYYYGDGKGDENGRDRGWIDRLLNPLNGRSGADKRKGKQQRTEGK